MTVVRRHQRRRPKCLTTNELIREICTAPASGAQRHFAQRLISTTASIPMNPLNITSFRPRFRTFYGDVSFGDAPCLLSTLMDAQVPPHIVAVLPGARDLVVHQLNVNLATTSAYGPDRSNTSEEPDSITSGMKGESNPLGDIRCRKHDDQAHTMPNAYTELEAHITPGSLHDSAERGDAPRCHAETRKAIQENILGWARSEAEPGMLWLNGPAGTGKTAILQTISERCTSSEEPMLAATFFFSYRTPETRSLRYLVPTVAYQLAQRIPALAIPILKAARADPSIFKKNEDAQIKALILAPLEAALKVGSSKGWPKLIVVDAVDECDPGMLKDDNCAGVRFRLEKEKTQRRILDVLLYASTQNFFPFRILVGSRPERAIRAFFNDALPPTVYGITLDKQWSPDMDIALLLRCRFRTLRHQFDIDYGPWPNEDAIRFLVNRASGQFIYVATIMRWIEEGTSSSHQERPDMVLCWENTHGAEDNTNPLQRLDNLYRHIVSSCPAPPTSCLWLRIVHFLSAANFPAMVVDLFLESQSGDVERVLGCLHSLLSVPRDKETKRYRFYHLSLPEFLANPSRCKGLYVSDEVWINYFVLRYLKFYRGEFLPVFRCPN